MISSLHLCTVVDIDALELGLTCCQMGAGREKTDDIINYGAGLQLYVQVGSPIETGQTWIRIHHDFEKISPLLVRRVASALTVSEKSASISSDGHLRNTDGDVFDGNYVLELIE